MEVKNGTKEKKIKKNKNGTKVYFFGGSLILSSVVFEI